MILCCFKDEWRMHMAVSVDVSMSVFLNVFMCVCFGTLSPLTTRGSAAAVS